MGRDVSEASISGRPAGPSASRAARRGNRAWIAHIEGSDWDMKVLLTCANRQFVGGNERSRPIVEELESIGFRFAPRDIPGGTLLCAVDSVAVDLETAGDVIDLQRRIGLPLILEDGALAIG